MMAAVLAEIGDDALEETLEASTEKGPQQRFPLIKSRFIPALLTVAFYRRSL